MLGIHLEVSCKVTQTVEDGTVADELHALEDMRVVPEDRVSASGYGSAGHLTLIVCD
jgi:hypothetical protein